MNKSFCVLPFYRTVVRTNGGIAPCCQIQNYNNIKTTSIDSFWKDTKLVKLRQNMLDGIANPECEICYKEEEKFGKSMRTESLRDHAISDSTDLMSFVNGEKYLQRSFPNHLEFHTGNLCNLKCLTCRPQDSSSFLSEDKVLNISNHNQQDYQISQDIVDATMQSVSAHGVEVLDLRGGETMLDPTIRQTVFDLPKDHKIKTLRLQTNCTILDDFWKESFRKFETVEIMMSIDAHGLANEYIRYPSQWQQIEKNVDYFQSCSNTKIYVNCTISNLNFLLLKPLIDWCDKKQIYFHHSFCHYPRFYHYTNLPRSVYETGLERLQNWPGAASLATSTADDSDWEIFCQTINKRDKHRRNSIFDILPELKPYWKNS